jgi:zinc protease
VWKYVVGVVLVAACGAAPPELPPPPEQRLSVSVHGSMFETTNGYRVAVMPSESARVVRLDVRYPVGFIDDPPGKPGLAHLVEHLLFSMEIMRSGAKTSVWAELDRVALSYNAETTAEYTDFSVVARPEALDELIALEADRLAKGCGGLTPAIFEHQREIVLEELRERQGAGGAALLRTIMESIYPANHPYRAVDSVESVAALDYKDVCDFLAGPYRRGIAVVVASGAVSEAAVHDAVTTHLAPLHSRQPSTRAPIAVTALAPGIVRTRGKVGKPTLLVTWAMPPHKTREWRLLQLPTELLAARLSRLAIDDGWGTEATPMSFGGESAPVFGVAIELTAANKVAAASDATSDAVSAAARIFRGNTASYI